MNGSHGNLQGSVTYQLPSSGLTWSSVFRQLEANKDRLGIIDYSVSQTTLEQVGRQIFTTLGGEILESFVVKFILARSILLQVFIDFAKEQAEEEN